mgnify:CR=1 FL=1
MSRLSLNIADEVINQARAIASKKGISLSQIVEQYLKSITKSEEELTPIVRSLSGVIKDDFAEDYKKELSQARKEKHFHEN